MSHHVNQISLDIDLSCCGFRFIMLADATGCHAQVAMGMLIILLVLPSYTHGSLRLIVEAGGEGFLK
jgi:hypothetical protein